MSLRRFLYLVANDCGDCSYSLRRIDTSRFFFGGSTEGTPTPLDSSGGAGAADPSAIEDGGHLPDPMINLFPPRMELDPGSIGFMLFKNKVDEGHDKVVATDNMGQSLICDPDLPPTVHYLPSMASPKFSPFSLTVGNSLYVLDAYPRAPNGRKRHSFEVLSSDEDHRSFKSKAWYWSPLDPPPHVYGPSHKSHFIDSYTVVAGSNIVVSNKDSQQTYCFDTVNRTWNKAGNWVLPFNRLAEYLPEHKLWFGISPIEEGYRFCGANLVASLDSGEMRPPLVHRLWKEYAEPPPEWSLAQTYAVHLGSSKFCIIRFFEIGKLHVCPEHHESYKREEELQAVLTGVEVENCGDEVRVVKHKSERYKLDVNSSYRVL
ncbi:unnamed protein product [Urochloa decumbens]|uniref:Uncharacterized protein n=1 Tax=Urochloa decumbens TaxID=240449 RepID=A0ABC9B898_9POAL